MGGEGEAWETNVFDVYLSLVSPLNDVGSIIPPAPEVGKLDAGQKHELCNVWFHNY